MHVPKTEKLAIRIEGLSCLGGGAIDVERRLARQPGVIDVYVNPATEKAYVTFDSTVCSVEDLGRVIERTGYRAGGVESR